MNGISGVDDDVDAGDGADVGDGGDEVRPPPQALVRPPLPDQVEETLLATQPDHGHGHDGHVADRDDQGHIHILIK